eukprot:COSAG01_NODE_4501_length_4971_cov_18.673645_3_plen_36_part_00
MLGSHPARHLEIVLDGDDGELICASRNRKTDCLYI